MKKTPWALVLIAILTSSSCNLTTFTTCVSSPPENAIDAAPFLGAWRLAELLGQPYPQGIRVSISEEPGGTLNVTFTDETTSNVLHVVTTMIGTNITVSAMQADGVWYILRVTCDTNTGYLVATGPDPSRIRRDIETGILSGNVSEVDVGTYVTSVSESGENLRTYFADNTTLFQERMLVLQRQ